LEEIGAASAGEAEIAAMAIVAEENEET